MPGKKNPAYVVGSRWGWFRRCTTIETFDGMVLCWFPRLSGLDDDMAHAVCDLINDRIVQAEVRA